MSNLPASLPTVKPAADGVVVHVRAHPGARRNGITGVRDGELCVAVRAPADRGRANDAIVRFLAKALGVPRGGVELIAGATNRHKRFVVQGLTVQAAREALAAVLPAGGCPTPAASIGHVAAEPVSA